MARWRRALVTGASAGIGEALAKQLAADGVDLVLVARRADRLDALADALRSSVCRVEVLPADLLDAADLEKVAARVADTESPIDLLVNNAGYGVQGAFATQPYADAKGQVDLNVQIARCNAGAGEDTTTSSGWVNSVGAVTDGAVGVLALGEDNSDPSGTFPVTCQMDAANENLGIDPGRVVTHMDRYGNTSAGSVPIALDESVASGRIRRGHHLLLCGFGAGLAWGTALVRW